MLKVTQLPDPCRPVLFQMVVDHSPVLSILPAGLSVSIFSSSLFSPFLPPCLSLSLFVCPLPVLSCSTSASLLASLLHSPTFCAHPPPHPHPSQSCLQLLIWGQPQESGQAVVPGDGQMPSLSLCPVAVAGRVGKGQRVEATVAQPGTGAQLWLGKKGGNKELGDRGRGGGRVGKGCPGAVNLSHSRLYERSWG